MSVDPVEETDQNTYDRSALMRPTGPRIGVWWTPANPAGEAVRRESLGSKRGWKSLNESIAEPDRELAERGKNLPGHRNLSSIKGIGDKSATIPLSVIGDIHDLAGAKKLAAHFGWRLGCRYPTTRGITGALPRRERRLAERRWCEPEVA